MNAIVYILFYIKRTKTNKEGHNPIYVRVTIQFRRFIQDGYEVIHRYSRGKPYEPSTQNYCFDDLGVENNLKYYGNECNIMAEIILSRYDLYITRQLQTHITTNLSASEIEALYGNRVRSRMRELFNLIAFSNDAQDKRR